MIKYPSGGDIMKKLLILLAFLTIFMNAVNVRGEVVNHLDDFVYNYSYSALKLYSITYGNNMFVAVGSNGAIRISKDGINWEGIKPLGGEMNFGKVIWNGSIFVALGYEPRSRIITSANGRDWTIRDYGGNEDIFDLVWDGKQFIALSCTFRYNACGIPSPPIKNWVLRSKDGITWSKSIIELGENALVNNIIYTGKEYIINSKYYSGDTENWTRNEENGSVYNCSTKSTQLLKIKQGEVSTSIDGENWIYKGKSKIPENISFGKILWNGKIFVGVDNGNQGILTSNDGVNWKSCFKEDIIDMCWNGKVFVALGQGTNGFYSSDGLKWNKSYSGIKENLNDIVYNGKKYVAVGGQGGSSDWDYGLTMSSTDGLKWEMNRNSIEDCLISVIWDGKKFVAVGVKSVYFSNDALHWSKASTQKCSFKDIIWNGKIYVAPVSDASSSSMIAYSKDGKKWTNVKLGEYGELNSIVWNGNRFLILSENKAYVSTDGVKWSINELNFSTSLNLSVKCIGTDFITYGADISKDGSNSSHAYISKDGVNWSKYIPEKLGKYGSNIEITNVERNFLQGENGFISPDGYNWLVLNSQEYIYGIAYNSNSGRFVAVGYEGTLIVADSKNRKSIFENAGIVWDKYENEKYNFNSIQLKPDMVLDDYDKQKDNINSVVFSGVTYVAVGDNGIIRTSSDSVKWTSALADTKSKLNYVLWNAGKFIAVGNKGTVLESVDGKAWKAYSLGDLELKKVIWDGKKYIIFGDNGYIYISKENDVSQDTAVENTSQGIVTNQAGSFTVIEWDSKHFEDLANGKFIDAECNGKNYVTAYDSSLYTSDDLEKWVQSNVVEKEYYYDEIMYYSIAWDGEKYTSVYSQYYDESRNGRTNNCVDMTGSMESYDGINWKVQDKIAKLADAYYLNYWVEVNGSFAKEHWDFQCLPKDLSWTERETGKIKQINKQAVWNGTGFVLVGKEGAIYTSNDGICWLNRTTSNTDYQKKQKKIIWDGSRFVMTTSAGIFSSQDGKEWAIEVIDKDKFEAVGLDGTVLRIKNIDVNKISSQVVDQYSDFYINKNSKGYIAVGGGYKNPLGYKSKEYGIVLLSKDGENWESVNTEVEGFLKCVVYSMGKYVAVGNNGSIVTSVDGINWEKQNSGIKNNLFDICTNGSKYVAAGEGGVIIESVNGVNWTKAVDDPSISFYDIIWDDIGFKAFLNSTVEAMLWSKDGTKWEVSTIDSSYGEGDSAFACNGDTYVVLTGKARYACIVGKNYGEKPISIFLNDNKLVFDTLPVIENGRTMVPMRAIFEALGAEVTWDDKSKSVKCVKEDKKIGLTIGSNQAILDSKSYTLEAVPKIVNGRTLVPLRFISESLGAEVNWDGTKRKVSVVSK